MDKAFSTMDVYELLRAAKALAVSYENMNLLNVVAELSIHFAQERGKTMEMVKENMIMKAKLDVRELRTQIQRVGRYYYFSEDNINWHSNGPFCIRCFDSDDKLITVNIVTTKCDESFCCPECGSAL